MGVGTEGPQGGGWELLFEPGSARLGRGHSVGLDLGHYLLEVGALELLLLPLGGHRACDGPQGGRARCSEATSVWLASASA